jgi:hypothetical protein
MSCTERLLLQGERMVRGVYDGSAIRDALGAGRVPVEEVVREVAQTEP